MDHDQCCGPWVPCICPTGQELERRLDATRAEGRLARLGEDDTVTQWWSHDHKPTAPIAPQPASADRVLWCLVKGEQRAEAAVRVIHGAGIDLRYPHNGDLRERRLYRDEGQLQASAAAKRNDLLAKGWVDPGSLAWGR